MSSPYFEQIEQNIKSLLAEKKYEQAYDVVIKTIAQHPEEKEFVELKDKIEKEVAAENDKVIERRLLGVNKLWKKEQYNEVLRELQEILELSPGNKKVTKQYQQAQTKYKEQVEALTEKFGKEQEKKLKKLLKESPELLIDELFFLEQNNLQNGTAQALIAKYRDKLIERKIKEKSDLLSSDKFEDIWHFINSLKIIDGDSPRIAVLEQEIKGRTQNIHREQKSEYVYRGKEHLDTLMKLKKYGKAIQMAYEILGIDKANKAIAKTLRKAKSKFFKQTQSKTIASIKVSAEKIKKEYQENKKNFIRA